MQPIIEYIPATKKLYQQFINAKEVIGSQGFADTVKNPIIIDSFVTLNSEPVALLSYSKCDSNNTVLIIDYFEVFASKRHQGLGKSIITNIKEIDEITSIVIIPKNYVACSFWTKCGFEILDYDNGIFMKWIKR